MAWMEAVLLHNPFDDVSCAVRWSISPSEKQLVHRKTSCTCVSKLLLYQDEVTLDTASCIPNVFDAISDSVAFSAAGRILCARCGRPVSHDCRSCRSKSRLVSLGLLTVTHVMLVRKLDWELQRLVNAQIIFGCARCTTSLAGAVCEE